MQFRHLIPTALLLLLSLTSNAQCLSGNCSQGSGIMIYASGVRYIGEFRNSRREGWGSCIFQDGSKYEGNWINDFPEGAGIKTFPNGREQKGYWKRGNLEREDQTLVLDQNRRIGILKSDCISGNCTNGNGIFLFPNGDIYVGDFVNGKRHGIGVCYYENRSEYRGRWVNDVPQGNGTLTLADGSSRMGYWKQGQIQDHQESQGLATPSGPVPPVRTIATSNCLAGNCMDGIGTYQFQDSTRTITQQGLEELTEKLEELISFPYTIINQSWGMRPSTLDRRPILGSHPDHQSVVIFNGLGTKGVSLAPYFSHVLAEWLEKGRPINKEVDIQRYKHYNYGGNLLR